MTLNSSSALSAVMVLGAFSLSACNVEDTVTALAEAINPTDAAAVVATVPVTDLDSIVGVYRWNEGHGAGVIDEGFIGIDQASNVTWYDYQGDSYDLGGNCYVIDDGYYDFAYQSENRFETNLGSATITDVNGKGLIIEFDESPDSDITLGNRLDLLKSYFTDLACPAASENPSDNNDGEKTQHQQEKQDKKDSHQDKKDSHENSQDPTFQDNNDSDNDKGGK
jgi:hypothetical protein